MKVSTNRRISLRSLSPYLSLSVSLSLSLHVCRMSILHRRMFVPIPFWPHVSLPNKSHRPCFISLKITPGNQSNMAMENPPFHDLSIWYQSISQHKAELWGFPIAMFEYQRVLGPCVRHGSKGHLLWQDVGHRVSCRGEEIVLQIFQSLQTSRYTVTKPLPNKYFLVIHQIAMETMAHSVRLISFIFSVAPS